MSTLKKLSAVYFCATPQPTDLNAAAFAELTWVKVENVITTPALGIADNDVSQNYIGTGVTQHDKGFADAGTGELVVGYLPADAGQDLLKTLAATPYNYAYRYDYGDAPDTDTTSTQVYSRCKVSGPLTQGGGGEDYQNDTYTLMFNQAPVRVEPTAIP